MTTRASGFSSDAKSSLFLGTDRFTIRPFSSPRDKANLNELCKDLWGGRDYVPSMAGAYEQDPTCDFVLMECDTTGEMVAVGNRRTLSSDEEGRSAIFVEAIRVSSKHQGRGIGTSFMRHLCGASRDSGAKEILACTASEVMRNIFAKEGVEMVHFNSAQFPDTDTLKELPGWSAACDADDEGRTENILKALKLEHLVGDEARMEKWEPVESERELMSLLGTLRNRGLMGHMPGLGGVMLISDDLRNSMERGLVRKLCDTDGEPRALLALVKGSWLRTLRTNYVCSVAARSPHDFDSAVWEACKSDHVDLIDGNPAFCILFDQSIPSNPNSLLRMIPMGFSYDYYRWEDAN